jgi:hypothetical protein
MEGYVISLTRRLDPSTRYLPEDTRKPSPFNGTVRSIEVYFPPGCEDLITLWFGIGNETITEEIVSGDGKRLSIPVNRPIKKGEWIWMIAENRDVVYQHQPTVEVILDASEG